MDQNLIKYIEQSKRLIQNIVIKNNEITPHNVFMELFAISPQQISIDETLSFWSINSNKQIKSVISTNINQPDFKFNDYFLNCIDSKIGNESLSTDPELLGKLIAFFFYYSPLLSNISEYKNLEREIIKPLMTYKQFLKNLDLEFYLNGLKEEKSLFPCECISILLKLNLAEDKHRIFIKNLTALIQNYIPWSHQTFDPKDNAEAACNALLTINIPDDMIEAIADSIVERLMSTNPKPNSIYALFRKIVPTLSKDKLLSLRSCFENLVKDNNVVKINSIEPWLIMADYYNNGDLYSKELVLKYSTLLKNHLTNRQENQIAIHAISNLGPVLKNVSHNLENQLVDYLFQIVDKSNDYYSDLACSVLCHLFPFLRDKQDDVMTRVIKKIPSMKYNLFDAIQKIQIPNKYYDSVITALKDANKKKPLTALASLQISNSTKQNLSKRLIEIFEKKYDQILAWLSNGSGSASKDPESLGLYKALANVGMEESDQKNIIPKLLKLASADQYEMTKTTIYNVLSSVNLEETMKTTVIKQLKKDPYQAGAITLLVKLNESSEVRKMIIDKILIVPLPEFCHALLYQEKNTSLEDTIALIVQIDSTLDKKPGYTTQRFLRKKLQDICDSKNTSSKIENKMSFV